MNIPEAARISLILSSLALAACSESPHPNADDIAAAEHLAGVAMTVEERELMLDDIRAQREAYDVLHELDLPNDLAPALKFDPGFETLPPANPEWSEADTVERPANGDDIAFLSVAELGALLRNGSLTSEELTTIYLDRIREHDDDINAVITLTDTLALKQARRADAELAQGIDRGPLHGIPYGLKDLAAVPGYPTTWGATPYKEQVIDEIATVAKRMEEAGAVLIAKTAVGALAWGDVWFDGRTNSPWNIEEGASGSSAGSAAGVAAGFFPIAIGTETWGSIVSPSVQNGVIGLRPTFGRVSRHGVMALSWSMDKVGAICRFAEDCGKVLDAIRGPDGEDASVIASGFAYTPETKLADLRIAWLAADFDSEYANAENDAKVIEALQAQGVELQSVALPGLPVESMSFILSAEAAAAFDELTRSGRDDLLVRQVSNAWPNVFRAARFIPAVEYLQANRLRTRLIDGIEAMFADANVDVVLAPCFAGNQLLATNLSGHPSVALPNGFDAEGMPTGICLIGKPFHEGELIAVARGIQRAADLEVHKPPMNW
ncbi:MAG TPA: amidase [Gammaproteobacteria bacterium]